MTTEELLALPDDGIERWLIQGQLRESRPPSPDVIPTRILDEQALEVRDRITEILRSWTRNCPTPIRNVICDETGCHVVEDHTRVVVDIACPGASFGEVAARIDGFRSAGVPLVWVISPHQRTVTIYRRGTEPELLNANQDLTAEPHLPGFRVPVAQIFA